MSSETEPESTGVNRRAALGTGALGGAALGAGLITATGRAGPAASRLPDSGEVAENLQNSTHLFHLGRSDPMRFDGGTLQGAHEGNFPVGPSTPGTSSVLPHRARSWPWRNMLRALQGSGKLKDPTRVPLHPRRPHRRGGG
jgi:hypothetical protein